MEPADDVVRGAGAHHGDARHAEGGGRTRGKRDADEPGGVSGERNRQIMENGEWKIEN